MMFKSKAFLCSFLAAVVCTVALPLIAEAINYGRGGQAFKEESTAVLPSVNVPETTRPSLTDTPSATETPSTNEPPSMNVPPTVDQAPLTLPKEVTLYSVEDGTILTLPLESYITGVVAAEMSYSFHSEALKAQAVAARTYCLYRLSVGVTHENGASLCTDYTHCTAFATHEELSEHYGKTAADRIYSKVGEAVQTTAGQILTYDGAPIFAAFHSRSYRYTEASENVWGGYLPYLRSVTTPEEDSLSFLSVKESTLASLFDASSLAASATHDQALLLADLHDSGRTDTLYYRGKALSATKLRSLLGLRSCYFETERTEDGWLFTVHGYGHGVGMSQYGANAMAKDGAVYDEILHHYYTDVVLTTLSNPADASAGS